MYALIGEMGKVVDKVEQELTPEGETLIVTSFASLDVENGRANIQVYLTPSELRSVRTREVGAAIRQQLPRFAGVDRIGVREPRGGPPGRAIDVEFTGATQQHLRRRRKTCQPCLKVLMAYKTSTTL